MVHRTLVLAAALGALLGSPNALHAQSAAAPRVEASSRLLRFPDVHGETVVFCYAGDLWKASIRGGDAIRLTSHPGLELFPRISPDGQRVAFTGQIDGDEQVCVMPLAGGEPQQLTYYPARGPLPERWGYDHQVLDWTPDGRAVLFRSARVSHSLAAPRLFVVPASGGLPTALPMPTAGSGGFAPDGRQIVYSPLFRDFRAWKRYEGGWAQDLWIFDPETSQARNITDHPRTDRDPMWLGAGIYFASDRTGTLNLFRFDPTTGATTQETLSEHWDVRWPAAGGPGEGAIVFEQGGHLVLFDVETKDQQPLAIRVPDEGLARRPHRLAVGDEVSSAGLSPKGERAVFAAHGDIFSAPIEHGPVRNLTASPDAHDRQPTWSPDGRSIAFLSDQSGEEQVWIVAQDGATPPRAVTTGLAVRLTSLDWAPDSQSLAFGDKDGVLRVVELGSGRLQVVADEERGQIGDHTWSPDGDYLAFSMSTANGLSAVHVWDRAQGQLHQVTPQYGNDTSPAWSADGERLFFLGARSWSPRVGNLEWDYTLDRQMGVFALALHKDTPPLLPPRSDEVALAAVAEADDEASQQEPPGDDPAPAAPTRDAATDPKDPTAKRPIQFEGLADRVERVPLPLENWRALWAVDGAVLAARGGGFYYGRDGDGENRLERYSFEDRSSSEVRSGVGSISLSGDRAYLLIGANGGFERVPVTSKDVKGGDGKRVATSGLFVDRNPEAEWRQIFHEVWRRFRDFFYAENMHGHDWEALRGQYEALLPHVRHRSDLNYLISEMIAELNVGHAYISGGRWERPDRPSVALPGALFRVDPASGKVQLDRILRGDNSDERYRSPLTAVGVDAHEGDYVLAVDGVPLADATNPYRLLRHKGGQRVTLTLARSADGSDARDVAFDPVASEDALHYDRWVAGRRAAVAALSGGRLGYLHVPDMGGTGLREFIKWFYPQRHLEGIVIDVRGNGGGNVSQMLIERLGRRVLMGTFGRTTGYREYPQATFEGHLVCVLDENSASDGDIFPAMFRRAGLGTLVGKRSWGGIIGITNRGNLIDGGVVNVPEFGNTELDGEWTIEGRGVEPDLVVENTVTELLRGNDPQLETAVRVLLDQIAADPRPRAQRPPDPVRNGR